VIEVQVAFDKLIPIPYIDSRTLMNRLDLVAGPHNWHSDVLDTSWAAKTASATMMISITAPNGKVARRSDGASSDHKTDPMKTALTLAFRRAAVHWNICACRSLYALGTIFATIVDAAQAPPSHRIKNTTKGWAPPELSIADNHYVLKPPATNHNPAPVRAPQPDPRQPVQPKTANPPKTVPDEQHHSMSIVEAATYLSERKPRFGIWKKDRPDLTWFEILQFDKGRQYCEWAVGRGKDKGLSNWPDPKLKEAIEVWLDQ